MLFRSTCCIPEHAEIHSAIPKALIVRRLSSNSGWFTGESAAELLPLLEKAGSLVIGPGMGTAPECRGFLKNLLAVNIPLVLDADALNLIAADPELLDMVPQRQAPTVLTPHAGELKRLLTALNLNPAELSRQDAALNIARKLNAVVIAKGARTLVTAPDGRFAVNLSGCPALATAGTGDILAGMTGAMLLKRDLDVFDAVRTAVFLHGQTAEITGPLDSRGYIADDFLPMIGKVIRSYSSSSME